MLEHNELEIITSEIAYLHYLARRKTDIIKYAHEIIGLERALEICGYNAITLRCRDYHNFVEVEVAIDGENFKYVFDELEVI